MSEKHIFCSLIDSPSSNWGFWRKVIDREKYINFDKRSFPDNAYFCNVLKGRDKINFEKVEIFERIGSPSADAEVYRIKYKDVEFAMKIMPRIDNDSETRNMKEIITAIQASENKDYFPITIAYGYCPDASYYISENNESSSFIPKAIEFNTIYKLRNQIPNKNLKKRFTADYSSGMLINNLKSKYNIFDDEKNDIQVDFLISELANGDLGNWMTKNRSITEWKKVLIDVITGTYYLTVLLKKVHPDLHPGNILILTDINIKALIHDFGRCYPVDENVKETYKASLLSFFGEFLSCSIIIPREILTIIQDLYKLIQKLQIDLDNIKYVYENIIYPFLYD